MGKFFNLDSPFVKFGNLLADVMILSLLWIVFSIPIITIGASTTALYYVMTRRISDREQYIIKDFTKSFFREFFKSTGVWIIIVLFFMILFFNIKYIDLIAGEFPIINTLRFPFLALQYFVLIELAFFTIFVFPTLARFELDFKTLIKNTLFLGNRHFLTSILCVAVAIILVLIGITALPIMAVFGMGIYSFITSYLIIRVFKKYRPELDENIINNNVNNIE